MDTNVILAGCPVARRRKAFERLGLPFTGYAMTYFGVEKGKTVITDQLVKGITMKVAQALVDGSGENRRTRCPQVR